MVMMMTLTPTEITLIRLQAGDTCTPPIVSDAQIQSLYTSTGSECGAVIGVIRIRMAVATTTTGVDTSGSVIANPATSSIKELLDYWQNNCPEAQPEFGTLTINLGIDEEIAS